MRQGDLEDAVGLAHQAVASGLKGTEQFYSYIDFLQELRTKDASEADGLFLQTMRVLGAQETVDVNDLLLAGTYVFQPSDHQTSGMRIGKVGPVVLVSVVGDRPNFPLSLKQAYLGAATASCPAQSKIRSKHNYVMQRRTNCFRLLRFMPLMMRRY